MTEPLIDSQGGQSANKFGNMLNSILKRFHKKSEERELANDSSNSFNVVIDGEDMLKSVQKQVMTSKNNKSSFDFNIGADIDSKPTLPKESEHDFTMRLDQHFKEGSHIFYRANQLDTDFNNPNSQRTHIIDDEFLENLNNLPQDLMIKVIPLPSFLISK